MKTINRWIIRDLLIAIAEGALLFTFVFLLKRIYDLTDLLVTGSMTVFSTLGLLFSMLPTIMILTLPMATLLGGLLVFGRIAQENELTALQAAGYTAKQLLVPPLILGVLLSGLLLWWGNRIAPKGLRLFEAIAANVLQDTTTAGIHPGAFNTLGDYVIIPGSLKDGTMSNVRLFEQKNGEIASVISAPTGTIAYAPRENSITLDMRQGNFNQFASNGNSISIHFDVLDFSISIQKLLQSIAKPARDIYRLKNSELQFALDVYPQLTPAEKQVQKRWYYLCKTELARRKALPSACLIMVLLGSLLGIKSGYGKRSSCYAMTVAIIFIYYILLNFGKSFTETGNLPAWFGLWIPNLIAMVFCGYLYYRATRV